MTELEEIFANDLTTGIFAFISAALAIIYAAGALWALMSEHGSIHASRSRMLAPRRIALIVSKMVSSAGRSGDAPGPSFPERDAKGKIRALLSRERAGRLSPTVRK